MLAGNSTADPSAWQNATQPSDVNQDGFVSPQDALLIANELIANGERQLIGQPDSGTPRFDVNGDTFTLSLGGQTTSAIARNASAATVKSALEALSTIGSGNVAVTKVQDAAGAQEWKLTFQNAKNGVDLAQTTIDTASVTYTGSLTNIQATESTHFGDGMAKAMGVGRGMEPDHAPGASPSPAGALSALMISRALITQPRGSRRGLFAPQFCSEFLQAAN